MVPVHDGGTALERCIESLLAQDYPSELRELLVVDNASRDESPAILSRYEGRIRILHESRPGAAAARNTGIRAAAHPFVAFIDCDCVADPGWLRELAAALLAHPSADFIGGPIAALEPRTPVERFEVTLHDQRRSIEDFSPPSVSGGNFLSPRERLLEFGLFDETYRRGEDSELCYRAYYAFDARFVYAGKATVHHSNRSTRAGLFQMGFHHGSAGARIWHQYRRQLGRSRWRRALAPRSYLAPLRGLWSPTPVNPETHAPDGEARQWARCDAIFRFAKELGFLVGSLRYH